MKFINIEKKIIALLIIVHYSILQENKIRIIGGQTPIKHLVNTLVITITNKLAKQLTWDGQRNTEGIKDTTYANTIIGKYVC